MAHAQPMDDSHATTEQSCSFGMAKGEASQTCHVPFPTGCLVANIPGTNKPWTTISKGGKTFCRFDEKAYRLENPDHWLLHSLQIRPLFGPVYCPIRLFQPSSLICLSLRRSKPRLEPLGSMPSASAE